MIRTVLTPALSPDVTVVPTCQILSHLVESSVEGRAGVDVQGLGAVSCFGPGWTVSNGFFLVQALKKRFEISPCSAFEGTHSSHSRISANIEPKLIELLKCHEVGWGKDNGRELLSWNPSLVSLPNPSWYCRSYPRKQLVSSVLFARGPPISALSSLHSSIIAIVLHVKLVQHLETFASKQQTECQPKECHLPYLQTGHDGFPTGSHGFTWSHSCQATLASSGPECSPRLLRKSCSTKWRQDGKQREDSELNVSACLIISHHITIHSNSEVHYKMARLLDLYGTMVFCRSHSISMDLYDFHIHTLLGCSYQGAFSVWDPPASQVKTRHLCWWVHRGLLTWVGHLSKTAAAPISPRNPYIFDIFISYETTVITVVSRYHGHRGLSWCDLLFAKFGSLLHGCCCHPFKIF